MTTAEDNAGKGKLCVAAEDYKATLAMDPNHTSYNIHHYLGLCKTLVKLGRGNEAISSCIEALNIDGEPVDALTQRGEAKLLAEDWEGAVQDLKEAVQKSPQIMASSLNGLSVGDSLADNIMESPSRSESASCFRDEIISQYSPMSEDSDDYRYYDTQLNPNGSQTDAMVSPSTSPMSSPHRFQIQQAGFLSANPCPLPGCSLSAVVCSHARRGSENEGRFPSSPNDMCHGADLRRTALLRSVQMRVQGPHVYDLSFGGRQEQEHAHEHEDEHEHEHLEGLEVAERPLSCRKAINDEAGYQRSENGYERPEHDIDYIDDCASDHGLNVPKFKQEDRSLEKFDNSMDKNR